MEKTIYIILSILISIVTLFSLFFFFVYKGVKLDTTDAKRFLEEGNYTKKELLLFSDVAFPYNRTSKWEQDIRVEIKNIEALTEKDIIEVDSIISILSPLIVPIKISRVEKNGNLLVFRKVDSISRVGSMSSSIQGFCYIPPLFKRKSYSINYCEVYDKKYVKDPSTILHEFEHALGLQHPSQLRPYFMRIQFPNIFKSFEESEKYDSMPYYLAEQEKKVLKMLYSPYIKSGLRKKEFIKKVGLKND